MYRQGLSGFVETLLGFVRILGALFAILVLGLFTLCRVAFCQRWLKAGDNCHKT
jgi:hypothetical protein